MKSIVQTDGTYCFECKMAIGTEDHHLIPGNPQRKYCEADGLKVRMCRECHDFIHSSKGSSKLLEYRRLGQTKWEAVYGDREAFIKRYGRSWL